MLKVAFINMYGQSGLTQQKLLELENFIQKNKLDIVCLQETNISESTFMECNYIYKNFCPFYNNNKSGYGTCTLVKKDFSVTNIVKDSDGRVLCLDIDEQVTVVNVYLPSGTDQSSKIEREEVLNNIPNLLLYKKGSGIIGGDFNCITDKQDSLIHAEQKISKCLRKIVKLYNLCDVFRKLYPYRKQFSRYYVSKGVRGATRIDRCYSWGSLDSNEATYHALSFSDHLGHVVNLIISGEQYQKENPRRRSIYKIKHWLLNDTIFLDSIRQEFDSWSELKDHFSPIYFWEEVVKPGVRKIAIKREKEINQERNQELQALQLKLDFHLSRLRENDDSTFAECLSNYESAKKNLKDFYFKRAKIILYQNRAEIFDMSDTTKIYHYESLNNYIKQSCFDKIEVDNKIFESQEDIEAAVNKVLEDSMSRSHSIDHQKFEQLFSFNVPQISRSDNNILTKNISKSELRKALRKLKSKASPGIDSIPSGLYVKLFDVFAPIMIEVFNEIIHGQSPPASMRTSVVQYLSKPKKAKSMKLRDKRKISVLCTDFKCIEKIMANRLKKVMSKFVSASQYAIKPKKISHATSTARDLINFVSKNKVSMGFMSLDMESAFDNLSMEFVYLCLAKYGFDVSAIKIFRNIYSDAMAMSYINGSMSKLIMDLSGNLRQGGCGSMEIFVVGVNPLLQLLEDKLKGVTIYSTPVQGPVQENEEVLKPVEKVVKVVGFVDDACPVVTSEEEFTIVDQCLQLFEACSGCKFHRNPSTQKCKITLYGSWKRKYNQNNIPLPFLQITNHVEILGILLYESWRTSQRENGSKILKKVKLVADKWKGGRFYDFLLRPYIVNTYLFSNIWYSAGVIDLQLGHLDDIQKRGNQYVHSDCFLKPQKVANYLEKGKMGLGIVHVRTKALALFIKNILNEANPDGNCYLHAVIDYYCYGKDLETVPVKPDYLTDNLINKIKMVLEKCKTITTRKIYQLLLCKEMLIEEDFKLKVQIENPNLDVECARSLVASKLLSLKVRDTLWKHFHNVIYDDIMKGKVTNSAPICKLCSESGVDRIHIYFSCEKLNGCGREFMNVLKNFGQFIEEDVLNLKLREESAHITWLVSQYVFYVVNKREKCSPILFKLYLLTEFETFKRSKHCDDVLVAAIQWIINLFGYQSP